MHWRFFWMVWAAGATLLAPQVQADGFSSGEKSKSERIEFVASRVVGHPGMEVRFTNVSKLDEPAEFLWDFGDGTSSTEVHPTHRYEKPGTYSVALYATSEKSTHRRIQNGLIQVQDPVFLADFESSATYMDGWDEWEGPEWDSEAAIIGEGGVRIGILAMSTGLVKMQNPNQTGTTGGGGCSQCLQQPGGVGGAPGATPGLLPPASSSQLSTAPYSYSWYFDLSDLTLIENDSFVMFKLRSGDISGEEVAGVELRYSGGRFQIRFRALESDGMAKTTWKNLGFSGTYYISLSWQAANPSLGREGSLEVEVSPVSSLSLSQAAATSVLNLDNAFLTDDYASIGIMDGHVMSAKPGSLKLDHFGIYRESSASTY